MEIELASANPENEYVERNQIEERYHSLIANARSQLRTSGSECKGSKTGTTMDSKSGASLKNGFVRLPKIDLPHFDGGYQCWLEFRDTFISLIHNSDCIDGINKFHYLRASLKGRAAEVIKNIDFKDENYVIAWDLLCDRYNNNRLLINNHVQALFDLEPITKESSASLRRLIDVINKNLRALKTLKEPTEYWDTLIIFMMSRKLDINTNRKWEEYRNALSESPTLTKLISFINGRADLLETLEVNQNKSSTSVNNKQKSFIIASTKENQNTHKEMINNKLENSKAHSNNLHNKLKCPLCSNDHLLYTCDLFKILPTETRLQKAKELRVCLNCLRSSHITKKCRLAGCKYCKSRHNTLLHVEPTEQPHQDPMPSASNSIALPIDTTNSVVLSADTIHHTSTTNVLLSTAMVKAVSNSGEKVNARILLDNGSTANFVTESLCAKLDLLRRKTTSTVTGINQQSSYSTQSCNLHIESYNGDYRINLDCLILPEITKRLPASYVDAKNIPIPSSLRLADPTFNVPAVIDILVGAEIFWSVIGTASIDLGKRMPKLYDTKFGWIVSGPVSQLRSSLKKGSHLCNFTHLTEQPNLTRFWELDSISSKHAQSQEERECELSFKQKTIRNDSGKFIVTMPLKTDPSVLGNSYNMAKHRFLSLERRFQREPEFKARYIEFMNEYENLGHMSEVNNSRPHSNDCTEYFIPHHGVIRESSTTTKLRAVFDASATTSSKVSLNDILMVGPKVQDDLLSILLRFRQHKYVVTGDIEKMYRCIEVTHSQRSLLQIIFRKDPKEPLKTYRLNTVTYGTSSAPYLATKCLVSLADDATTDNVRSAIARDFYVDDYLGGGSTKSETIDLVKQINSILSSAHFFLRKWQSNSPEILEEIAGNSGKSGSLDLSSHSQSSNKTLGLHWFSNTDTLSFSINISAKEIITKRHILSVISQVFDPLGLVGPCIVEAKLIMQRLWVEQSEWDDEVSSEIVEMWSNFVRTLPSLNSLNIPRWVCCNLAVEHELHIFCDASEKAYGACIYVRSVCSDGSVNVQLLVSKNRVAPIKTVTIPRLELCAALLGTRLCTTVTESLTMPIDKRLFWSDSMIVLGWLNILPNQLKPFVRNRVAEIQESTAGDKWRYVPSKDNPADLVSRGARADSIGACSLWWTGPSFLHSCESSWPIMPCNSVNKNLPEVVCNFTDQVDTLINSNQSSNNSIIRSLIQNNSNFNRLQRIIAYIYRFIHNLKNSNCKLQGSLSTDELDNALTSLLLSAQADMFPIECNILKSGKSLPHKNRLISLTPFVDTKGIIRVGGRLDNSPYDYNTKYPILLCSKHHLTRILFHMQHKRLLHAGPQLLLANMRLNYWPLGGRNLAKTVVKQCLKCFRYKCQNIQPMMGQLPCSRTNITFPFFNSSVDYAGPVLIADRKGRGCKLTKSYLCIFVCHATKAVHLELVTDLTKEGFIAALNRFTSRRGKPQSILSDNGTNFVGADNDLKRIESDVASEMAEQGIKFVFAPPYSPHFNGMAEAAVKSTKNHLRKLLSLTNFTYEELATCLCQIEAVLNSRPLTPLSCDPSDLSVLTPSHFLIGRTLTSIPCSQVPDKTISCLDRFKRIEYVRQHFWQRFSNEYVSSLQQKTKWSVASDRKLREGTLVLIREKALPPLVWALGRVVRTYAGVDGITRVADVKTKRGVITRGFNNICPLPFEDVNRREDVHASTA
ncbi:uncharacterized protein LOC118279021 isoform X1 [Spodoptera frugiperda]|uniref:Uncharacterized protein LOC118279021 isoform X1 n=1 Tax=Spodoptera frugiperda TaxID=7108 RepID=A0A9R0DRH0_SPOFR|nr:uncharacterized protein LOC118279021 isoform X1 [Spodoptera frugiperda]XP_050551756.1 uncharacterized protein LOC118279021 isoform X1 [Spodoptera frugiperda]